MTERLPSANKQTQILDEVRQLSQMVDEKLSKVREDIAEVKTKVEMQPKIDEQKFNGLNNSWVNCKANCDKQIGEVVGRVVAVEKDVAEIKGAPGKKYEKTWDTIRNIVLGILLTYLAIQMGLK